jgi:RAB6A-GEF complex partner protein 2
MALRTSKHGIQEAGPGWLLSLRSQREPAGWALKILVWQRSAIKARRNRRRAVMEILPHFRYPLQGLRSQDHPHGLPLLSPTPDLPTSIRDQSLLSRWAHRTWETKICTRPDSLHDLHRKLYIAGQPASRYIREALMGIMMGLLYVSITFLLLNLYLTTLTARNAPEVSKPIRKTSANLQSSQALGRASHAYYDFARISSFAGNFQNGSRRPSRSPKGFRFPLSSDEGSIAPSSTDHPQQEPQQRLVDEAFRAENHARLQSVDALGLATKVLAGTSVAESARSSGDLQSLSNRSQETLLSEQASNPPDRHIFPSPIIRQHYRMDSTTNPKRLSETLLMGYAQVNANFTLDGALVDQTPFEEVKRKGFVGGQGGGGVVGIKTPSNARGLLGGFNLNSIGESLGGLLGGADLSSLKEMKGVVSSRAVPLLSTPQSLLFVDLTLMPGEERSFSFHYNLPKGLPASYKGKTIKISYNLKVGVQGAPGDKAVQAIRCVNIPFRVFSSVNNDGELFGHDLMQPYVILKDTAQTETVESASTFLEATSNAGFSGAEAANQDFLTYVDTLLNRRRRRQSSTTTIEPPRSLVQNNGSNGSKQAIDRAIFLSKQSSASQQSPSRFEIARNGKRIATVVLDRTLHRLGESVTVLVDLSHGQMPCYSLRCSLETTEKVNPALALRSVASITRLSRRVYRSHSENTLFAERVIFSPSVPTTASPTLLTSGVNLDWGLRFEFVTTRVAASMDENVQNPETNLLESVTEDDRGSILAAVETLQCETFEVAIPITVYGDTVVTGADADEPIGLPI